MIFGEELLPNRFKIMVEVFNRILCIYFFQVPRESIFEPIINALRVQKFGTVLCRRLGVDKTNVQYIISMIVIL